MYEEIERRRTNLHAGGQRRPEKAKKGKIGFTGMQAIVCAVCVLAAVAIRFAGGGVYTLVRGNVSGALNKPITGSQVNQVFANIKSALPDMSDAFASGSSKSSSSGKGTGSGSSGSSASGTGASSSSSSSSDSIGNASSV